MAKVQASTACGRAHFRITNADSGLHLHVVGEPRVSLEPLLITDPILRAHPPNQDTSQKPASSHLRGE